jgi:hypothetical protein
MTLLDMTTGHRVHARAERKNDLYETPNVGTRSLFYGMGIFNQHGLRPTRVWEPCAGPGAMVAELRGAGVGVDVVATELLRFRRKTEPGIQFGVDFLAQALPPPGVDVIVTNPPFMYADAFLAHALDLVPVVYMLLRVGFIGSERWNNERKGEYRRHLDRVMIFSPRLPMMHRDGWKGPKNDNPAIDFAWYRFERDINVGGRSPTVTWFDWRTVATHAELAEIRARRRRSAAAAKRRKAKLILEAAE